MWLRDVNVPAALTRILRDHGIAAETAATRGWRELTNGALARVAAHADFKVILTRDRGFGVATTPILDTLPDLAIVIVTLPQVREVEYLRAFEAPWQRSPIRPIPGRVVEWP